MSNPPNSFRAPEPGKGRMSGGDRSPRSGRRPGPDPVAELIERAAFYNLVIKVAIILAAAVALVFVVAP